MSLLDATCLVVQTYSMTTTVATAVLSEAHATYLRETSWPAGVFYNKGSGITTLTPETLDVLADLELHVDGHYDGSQIWIGGTGYLVSLW